MKKFIFLWGPFLLFAALMFTISSMSISIGNDPFPFFDKVAHVSEYTIFAILLFRALSGTLNGIDFLWVALLTVIITLGYGMSDEFHQSFVPARTPDIKDLVADGVGAVVAMTALFIKRKVFRRFSD